MLCIWCCITCTVPCTQGCIPPPCAWSIPALGACCCMLALHVWCCTPAPCTCCTPLLHIGCCIPAPCARCCSSVQCLVLGAVSPCFSLDCSPALPAASLGHARLHPSTVHLMPQHCALRAAFLALLLSATNPHNTFVAASPCCALSAASPLHALSSGALHRVLAAASPHCTLATSLHHALLHPHTALGAASLCRAIDARILRAELSRTLFFSLSIQEHLIKNHASRMCLTARGKHPAMAPCDPSDLHQLWSFT